MLRLLALLAVFLINPLAAFAQDTKTAATAEAEVRDAIRQYDEALRKADSAAAQRFWAEEYVFINPRGERLTRSDRIANLKSGQTAINSVEHAPKEEHISIYGNGDVAVYTTLLTISGQYGGKGQQGELRGLVVWVRRDGRWQQIASQVTPVAGK